MRDQRSLIGAGWRFPLAFEAGRVALVSGEEEIIQAIWLILSTPVGSRVMRPAFGCRIHELLFAPINAATLSAAEHYIRDALGYWEPRITVLDVRVEPHPAAENAFAVSLSFEVKTTLDRRTLVFPFYTIPEEEG
ncbi:MAG: GPW/gp25 family protein [Chloroflexi bacterium]|nr:GPW/gp25 family protein [Chloroflexota bacterium]